MMRERARQWLRPLMLALCVEGRGCAFASTVCGSRWTCRSQASTKRRRGGKGGKVGRMHWCSASLALSGAQLLLTVVGTPSGWPDEAGAHRGSGTRAQEVERASHADTDGCCCGAYAHRCTGVNVLVRAAGVAHTVSSLCGDQRKARFFDTYTTGAPKPKITIRGLPSSATSLLDTANTVAQGVSDRLRLFCVAEWCYSAIDRGYFLRNEFEECLAEMRIPSVSVVCDGPRCGSYV